MFENEETKTSSYPDAQVMALKVVFKTSQTLHIDRLWFSYANQGEYTPCDYIVYDVPDPRDDEYLMRLKVPTRRRVNPSMVILAHEIGAIFISHALKPSGVGHTLSKVSIDYCVNSIRILFG